MAVTAQLVKELRERTGAGMMDCKKALVETDGDIEKAIELLREKGLAKAAKKAGRIAAEGLVKVAMTPDHDVASIVEVNSETDFVAKNEEFVQFVDKLAEMALNAENDDMEAFRSMYFEDEGTVEDALKSKIAKIGENLNIRRFHKLNTPGVVYTSYIHGGGKIGVVVGLPGPPGKGQAVWVPASPVPAVWDPPQASLPGRAALFHRPPVASKGPGGGIPAGGGGLSVFKRVLLGRHGDRCGNLAGLPSAGSCPAARGVPGGVPQRAGCEGSGFGHPK